ncbi:MAG: YadA-like family protein [Acidithiobacillus sp.]
MNSKGIGVWSEDKNGNLTSTGAKATGTNDFATGKGASATGESSIAIGTDSQANYSGSVAIGAGAQALADPTTAIGNNAVAAGANSTAIGANSTANGSNSVALGQGSVANRPTTVSVGDAATGLQRQITNVAPGTAPNDAATYGQVQGAMSSAVGQAKHYADQVGSVNAASLNAAAAAAAGQGPNTVAGGYGEYNGQSAFAFTYQHRFNCNWTGQLTVGSNGSGNNTAVGGGASYSW